MQSIIQTKLVLILQKHKTIFKVLRGDGVKESFSLFSEVVAVLEKGVCVISGASFRTKVVPNIQYAFKWLWD